jgi:hypothetical protein
VGSGWEDGRSIPRRNFNDLRCQSSLLSLQTKDIVAGGENTMAFVADGVGTIIPGVTGLGLAFKGSVKVVEKAPETLKLLPKAEELMKGNAKVLFKNDNIELSEHAVKQMSERGFTVQDVERTMKNNKPFEYL